MKRIYFILLFIIGELFGSLEVYSADLNILQMLQFSSYSDTIESTVPSSDVVITDTQPVYLSGYYFMDTRFQNIGTDKWMFRGLFKMKAIFYDNRYIPDIRYLYFENKKPVGNHWFFSGGRINSANFLTVQRLDGINISYTPDADKGWLFGLIGGMTPVETSGYRSYYYSPYRAGAYTEYRNKNADHLKIQYNAGFGAGIDIFHQGQLEGTKSYLLFKAVSFIRAGLMFTYPYNSFDYAFAENTIQATSTTTHTVGYQKSETMFLQSNNIVKEDYQQAFYRFSYKSSNEEWLLNLRGGYTYAMLVHGYIGQAQLWRKKLFAKGNGVVGLNALIQKKGIYDQFFIRGNLGFFPVWLMNVNISMGYEYFKYREKPSNTFLFGVNVQGELPGDITFEATADWHAIAKSNTDFYASFSLVHLINTHLGKRKSEVEGEPGGNER